MGRLLCMLGLAVFVTLGLVRGVTSAASCSACMPPAQQGAAQSVMILAGY
jgi:hypothetical protein